MVMMVDGARQLESLNALLQLLRQAFDEPDRTRTASREIRKLREKDGTFSAYLAEFGRIMEDLSWNKQAQREQLYERLSNEIMDALITSLPQICRELHNRIRARAAYFLFGWVVPAASGTPDHSVPHRGAGKKKSITALQ